MTDLADALDATHDMRARAFPYERGSASPRTRRALWLRPSGRRCGDADWGLSIDRMLGPLDVVHVAGRATPPTRSTPLLISVDDLRPLRGESREHQRVDSAPPSCRSRRAARRVIRAARVMRCCECWASSGPQVVVVPPGGAARAADRGRQRAGGQPDRRGRTVPQDGSRARGLRAARGAESKRSRAPRSPNAFARGAST